MWCGIQKLLVTQSGEGISDLFPTPSSGSTPPCLTSCSPFHCAHHHPQNRSAHSQCPISCSAVSQKARKFIPRGGRGFFSFTKRTARFLTKKSRITHTRRQPPLPLFFSFPPHFQILQTCTNIYNPFGGQTRPLNPSPPFAQLLLPVGKWIGAQYFCGTEVPCRSRSTTVGISSRRRQSGSCLFTPKSPPFPLSLNYTRNGSPALYVRNAHLRTYVGSSRRRRKWKGGEGALIKKSQEQGATLSN